MKRAWFQADDGTYFRNCPLISAEMERCDKPWRWRRFWALQAEWERTFRQGVLRKDRLGREDVLVQMASFREAYPDDPRMWVFDRE